MVSALQGVFTEHTLTYDVQGAQSGTDAYGNPTYTTTQATATVLLEVSNSAALAQRYGADAVTIMFTGTAIDPAVLPDAIQPGREFSVSWRGKAGTLTILQVDVDPLSVLDSALGQAFTAKWRPSDG